MKSVWIEGTDDVGYVVDPDFMRRISVSDTSWTLTADQHMVLGSRMNGRDPARGWAEELLGTVVTKRVFEALLTLRERRLKERNRKTADAPYGAPLFS